MGLSFPPRAALSLLEVLFAIFVASLGLLALAALVPLGQFYGESGARLDRAGSMGREAQRRVEAAQMLRWENWIQLAPSGSYVSNPTPWLPIDANGNPQPPARPFAFLIDPLYHARVGNIPAIAFFPHTPSGGGPQMTRVTLCSVRRRYDPLLNNLVLDDVPLPTGAVRGNYLRQNVPMPLPLAESLFLLRDDLAATQDPIVAPRRPAIMPELDANAATLADDIGRQVNGNYSFAVMVRPADTETAYRLPASQASLRGGLSFDDRRLFHVTVIVFHKRDFAVTPGSERQIANTNLEFVGDDAIILRAADAAGLVTNSWIMVSGFRKPPVEGNPGGAITDHYWYRVTSIGRLPPGAGAGAWANVDRVLLRVAGPRWNHNLYQGTPPYTAWVTIVPTVVGVYERTVELDARSLHAD